MLVVGAACRDGNDVKSTVVIARSPTTISALPGPTILSEDGTIIGGVKWRQRATGPVPHDTEYSPSVGSVIVPSVPYGPSQSPDGTTTGTGGTRPWQTPSDNGSGGTSSPTGTPASTPRVGVPDGAPYGPALPFSPAVPVPEGLVFVLAIGSDARPGTEVRRGNADSLHLLAIDPATGSGTVLGFPRDSWVEIPGRGKNKINAALRLGGPQLMAETIRLLTGLPVHYTILTGFDGFQRMVDELGGVNVNVGRAMDDADSGAVFDPGWHNMTGAEALAYARNRKDAPNGDFSRSEAQGHLMLSGLSKLRAEVGDDGGLARWIDTLMRHADLDSPPWELRQLATLARTLDPSSLKNLVVPGRNGTANNQFVVFLGDDAARLFLDLRADAVIGGA